MTKHSSAERPEASLEPLRRLVRRLRAPDGCPWDREQRLPDLRGYLLEEAHELAAAVDTGQWDAIEAELGDLLFMATFLGRLGEEAEEMSLGACIERIQAKMVRRHPHVFGEESLDDAEAVRRAWEERKLRDEPARSSLLDGVPASLPALLGAYRMSQKAAGVGFDWPDLDAVRAKMREEEGELDELLDQPESAPADRIAEEVGDLLFTVANLARKLGVDPEAALAGANRKFRRRFGRIEGSLAAEGRGLLDVDLEEMERRWETAKDLEAQEASEPRADST